MARSDPCKSRLETQLRPWPNLLESSRPGVRGTLSTFLAKPGLEGLCSERGPELCRSLYYGFHLS